MNWNIDVFRRLAFLVVDLGVGEYFTPLHIIGDRHLAGWGDQRHVSLRDLLNCLIQRCRLIVLDASLPHREALILHVLLQVCVHQ